MIMLMKKFLGFGRVLAVMAALVVLAAQVGIVSGKSFVTFDGYTGGGGGTWGSVGSLCGSERVEQVWSYFSQYMSMQTLPEGVEAESVVAGIVGNLQRETGSLNPFARSGSGAYYGIYQTKLEYIEAQIAEATGGAVIPWGTEPNESNRELAETVLKVELDILTGLETFRVDGNDYPFMKYLDKVTVKTGSGGAEAYSELAELTFERAGYIPGGATEGYSAAIVDAGVLGVAKIMFGDDLKSGNLMFDKLQHADVGRQNAANVYAALAGAESACAGGGGELVSGGMNLQQAQEFMQEYIQLQTKYAADSRKGQTVTINDLGFPLTLYFSESCAGGRLSNCSTFTEYFVGAYTTGRQVFPNGGLMVQQLLATGSGFVNGGHTPRAYAVFSDTSYTPGHTGVVLGIDEARGKIIIGEAGCSTPASWTGAHEKDLAAYQGTKYQYAYTDSILKGGL
jgi:hypothetical protein